MQFDMCLEKRSTHHIHNVSSTLCTGQANKMSQANKMNGRKY